MFSCSPTMKWKVILRRSSFCRLPMHGRSRKRRQSQSSRHLEMLGEIVAQEWVLINGIINQLSMMHFYSATSFAWYHRMAPTNKNYTTCVDNHTQELRSPLPFEMIMERWKHHLHHIHVSEWRQTRSVIVVLRYAIKNVGIDSNHSGPTTKCETKDSPSRISLMPDSRCRCSLVSLRHYLS